MELFYLYMILKNWNFFATDSVAHLDPHHFGRLDPDPHQSGKLDPDPHQSEKQDQNPHQSEKMEVLKCHFGVLEAPNLEKSEL